MLNPSPYPSPLRGEGTWPVALQHLMIAPAHGLLAFNHATGVIDPAGRVEAYCTAPPVAAALSASHHQMVGKPEENSGSVSGRLKRFQRAVRE